MFAAAAVLVLSVRAVPASPPQKPASKPPVFTVQDLGPLPYIADDVSPSVSETGEVSFWYDTPPGVIRGAVWSQGHAQTLKGFPGYPSSVTHALNAQGVVAGWTSTSLNCVDSRAITRAFVCSGNRMTLLRTLGGRNSQAFAINSQNTVVGVAQCANGARHAFSSEHGVLHDLGTLPGGNFSLAYAVNSSGHTVGDANSRLPYNHAVCWRGGHISDLGLLPGGTSSEARAINRADQIAGFADTPDGTHAFLYSHGKMRDLGTLGSDPSSAVGLNDQGQVVGSSSLPGDQQHAFLWQNGTMLDLNNCIAAGSPWIVTEAFAINNADQIICSGHRKDGQAHILFLTLRRVH